MKNDAKVYILGKAKGLVPICVDESLKNLVTQIGAEKLIEDRKPAFQDFKTKGFHLFEHNGEKFRITCRTLKAIPRVL